MSPFLFSYYLFLPLVALLALAGCILFLAAMHGFANYYKDRAIFRNVLYGVISDIGRGLLILAVFFLFVFTIVTNPMNLPVQTTAVTSAILPDPTLPPATQAISSIFEAFAFM
jgi:uncharacterized membrane protein